MSCKNLLDKYQLYCEGVLAWTGASSKGIDCRHLCFYTGSPGNTSPLNKCKSPPHLLWQKITSLILYLISN